MHNSTMNNYEQLLENEKAQLLKGGLGFMVLGVIKANPKIYGGKILENLEQTPFRTQEGTLYPLLAKLRRWGFIDYAWQESPSGPPRKCYKLTKLGQQHYEHLAAFWQDLSNHVAQQTKEGTNV